MRIKRFAARNHFTKLNYPDVNLIAWTFVQEGITRTQGYPIGLSMKRGELCSSQASGLLSSDSMTN